MTKSERLALLIAFEKRLKPQIDEAKAEARQALMEDCERDGTDRRAILVGREKVGEVGVSWSAPKAFVYPGMEREAVEFLRACGLTEEVPAKGWEGEFELVAGEVVHKATGEVASWAGWQGREPRCAQVRGCEPQDVLRAFGNKLSGVSATALLEGEVR